MIKLDDIKNSWKSQSGVNSNADIDNWLEHRKNSIDVKIEKIPFSKCSGWMYDKGSGFIRRNNMSFFAIAGTSKYKNNVLSNQPIILQPEIGYLGIICKRINGILHFLMQAKIEPGNINHIQISPTIQATKSNFTQKHGGSVPLYLDYFLSAKPESIIVDQIQSEQSSRFFGKRNRNIVILVDKEVSVSPNHIWMTLGQIKRLMKKDDTINMDTRTVISSIPYLLFDGENISLKENIRIFNYINDFKMFEYTQPEIVDIFNLKNWIFDDYEYKSEDDSFPFKIIFCDISIEGREVRQWCQPLFEATKSALFGLFVTKINNKLHILVKSKPEIGCKDGIELGPTIQSDMIGDSVDSVYMLFDQKLKTKQNVLVDVFQSEEGGRFYHESNRNVIIEIKEDEIKHFSREYCWCDLATLQNYLLFNNVLNIQLRSLISLLDYETVFGED